MNRLHFLSLADPFWSVGYIQLSTFGTVFFVSLTLLPARKLDEERRRPSDIGPKKKKKKRKKRKKKDKE